MKRVTEKSLLKLNIQELESLLKEKQAKKTYMNQLLQERHKKKQKTVDISSRVNTLENQIYLIKKVLNNKKQTI